MTKYKKFLLNEMQSFLFPKCKVIEVCHKLRYFNPYIIATKYRRSSVFQTIKSIGSKYLRLKYQWCIPLGCKDIEIKKCEFVEKTQFV